MINSILNSGLQGVSSGMERMHRAAGEIAKAGTEEYLDINKLTSNLVELHAQEVNIKANLSVLKMADGVLGTLIDVRA